MEDGDAVAVRAVLKNIKEAIHGDIRLHDDLAEAVFFGLYQCIADGIALLGQAPEVSRPGILFVIGKGQKDHW